MNSFFELNDGNRIPKIGFGTWRLKENREQQVVEDAIEVGYRFFDTASLYGSEKAIGAAVNASSLPRKEFYLSSKVWLDEMGYQNTIDACNRSLERLGTDFLDLYLIHWPRKQGMSNSEWKHLDIETWNAMEFLASEGKVKSIGVSNFLPHHLNNLLDNCEIVPAINQLELHAGYFQEAAV
ncbi:aldo/keto reductase, partial [Globicatella sulfidifaciens]